MDYLSELVTKNNKNTSKNKKTDTIISYQAFVKIVVGHGGVEPPYGAYKAPALTDELMAHNEREII